MGKLLILAFAGFLVFDGINAILTGEISPMMGIGVGASHKLINYQESQVRFIIEVTLHLVVGGGLIGGLLNSIKK